MNNMKKLLALLLAMVLVLGLCACDAGEDKDNATDGSTESSSTGETEPSGTTPFDGKVTYTVKVVDESGNPISGALVQLCLDACIPSATNASGVATYKLEKADYKVSFMKLPDGYTYTTDATEFHFASGSYELTITLKAVA